MSAPLNSYLVTLTEWNVWEICIEATSQERAEAKAQRLLCEEGDGPFKHRNCGIEDIESELLSAAEGGAA
jgi:hypothetical protein